MAGKGKLRRRGIGRAKDIATPSPPEGYAATTRAKARSGNGVRLTFSVCLAVLLIPRLLAAYFSPVADCDETFNYWEPVHFMLFGFGQQTWEYSPVYALRSYAYLLPHALVARIGMVLSGWLAGGDEGGSLSFWRE